MGSAAALRPAGRFRAFAVTVPWYGYSMQKRSTSVRPRPHGTRECAEVSTLTEIQRIARRLATAETRTDKIRAERDAAIVAARARGESPSLIATAADLSEPAVFKILRAARKGA